MGNAKKSASLTGLAATTLAPVLESSSSTSVPAQRSEDADTILLVPVRNMVLFPTVVLPVVVSRPRSIATIQEAVQKPQQIGLVLQRDSQVEDPSRADLHDVGTVAEIVRYLTAPDGKHHAICQGQQRFRLLEIIEPTADARGLRARIQRIEEESGDPKQLEARFLAVKQQAGEVLQLSPGAPEDLVNAVASITSPTNLCDMVATFLDIPVAEKQELLETIDVEKRLQKIGAQLGRLSQVLQLSQKIRAETKGTLDKAQREYFLREQLRQIQKELDGEDGGGELGPLKKALEKAELPPEARKEADRELTRLERMNEASSEYSTTRTYLDVLSELPWAVKTQDNLDLFRAREVLDADHYGLEKVKRLILEYLAVRKLKPDGRRANLCLVGPPGVGKTSLGQSSRARWGASSCACRSAACTTRRRSAAIVARTSARCRATCSKACARRGRRTPCSCSTRWTSSARASRAIRPPRCSRCSTPSRTAPSAITT